MDYKDFRPLVTIEMQLRYYREKMNLSQEEVASEIGVKRYTYAKWEQGRSEPSIQDLISLSQLFECSIDNLVGNDENDFGFDKESLTEKENELLTFYSLLNPDQQSEVIGFIKAFNHQAFVDFFREN